MIRTVTTLSLIALAALSMADERRALIRKDAVIQIRIEDDLSLQSNRVGDRFVATVLEDRDIPAGSRFEGRIIDLEPRTDDRPGTMDLAFNRIVLPDGSWVRIKAVPIDLKYAKKGSDGRFVVSRPKVRKENYVLGGLVGGTILGSLINKPFEGAFVGTLAGILGAEGASGDNKDSVLKRGQVMGALVQQDFEIVASNGSSRRLDPGSQDQRVAIEYKGKVLEFPDDLSPYRSGEVVMVPLSRFARIVGLDLNATDDGKTFFLESEDNILRIEQDSRNCRLNGRQDTLPRPTEKRGSVLFVPLDAFSKMGIETRVKLDPNR